MPDLIGLGGIEALSVPSKRDDLVCARLAIHANASLQEVFERAESEQWGAERLARVLQDGFAALEIDVDSSVCRYLADEFGARDKTTTLLVSAETGLAVAQVPEDAIYVPAPVAREGSDQLAVPLPRLKPEIEAAIIQHQNVAAGEPLLIAKLAERARSTVLQRAEGDTRLRIATRSGRKKIAEGLRRELPELLRDHQGLMGRLFERCRVNEPIPEACATHLSLTLHAHASILVADALSSNFRHDPHRALRERIRAGWGRDLARTITRIAHQGAQTREVTVKGTWPPGLLIGSPDLARMAPSLKVVPVPGVLETVVTEPFLLVVKDDDAYTFESYETAARWYVDASVRVDLYLDTKTLHPLMFSDIEDTGLVVEVLS